MVVFEDDNGDILITESNNEVIESDDDFDQNLAFVGRDDGNGGYDRLFYDEREGKKYVKYYDPE